MADNSLAVAVPAPKFGDGWLSAFSLVAVAALVFSFVSFQRAGSQGGGNNGHLPAPVEAAGKAVFSTAPGACGSCHGATGGGGVGPKLFHEVWNDGQEYSCPQKIQENGGE